MLKSHILCVLVQDEKNGDLFDALLCWDL